MEEKGIHDSRRNGLNKGKEGIRIAEMTQEEREQERETDELNQVVEGNKNG